MIDWPVGGCDDLIGLLRHVVRQVGGTGEWANPQALYVSREEGKEDDGGDEEEGEEKAEEEQEKKEEDKEEEEGEENETGGGGGRGR